MPSSAATRGQLERILASPAFQGSARRRTLLRYLVEESLAGHADRLKGFTIAVAVFGRDESFDPQTDPVVRLEARRLRRDLDGYYATVGRGDTVRISIPKGGYVPEFEWRREEGEPAEDPPASENPLSTAKSMPVTTDVTSMPPAQAAISDPDTPAGPAPRPHVPRFGLFALFVAVMALIGLMIGHILFGRHDHESSEATAARSAGHGPAVIILPFESLSSNEDDAHLAQGLSQQLVTDLMRFDAFRIYEAPVAPGSAVAPSPVDLGRRFDVAYVVKGTVRSEAGMVRVGIQLIDGKTAEVLWSETYDNNLTPDSLILAEDNLSTEIATRLGQPYGVVRSITAEHLSKHRPRTLFAYRCMQQVYDYRRTFSLERQAKTQACLEEAVRQDPDYAEAWAFLGWLRIDPVRFGVVQGDEAARLLNQALVETSHAVSVAPKSPVVLEASAAVAWYRGDHEQSESIQRQALALNPNDPDILAQLGWQLAARGHWNEGLEYLSRAIERTMNPPAWYFAAFALHDYLQGDYAKALSYAEQAKTDGFGIGWSLVAAIQAALGNQETARAALAQMATVSPLLAHDPAAAYRIQQIIEPTTDAVVAGLRKAGWTDRPASSESPDGS